jgi:hypothetical protein
MVLKCRVVLTFDVLCGTSQDWEDGLSESDADGSLLHERRNFDLKLFSVDEEGAYNLLQVVLVFS